MPWAAQNIKVVDPFSKSNLDDCIKPLLLLD